MPRLSRVLLALASGLMVCALALPLWRIQLVAPQYPEGLGMEIRAHTVRGVKEHDLENINKLNHYIGMRAIEPDAIAELRVIPWFVVGLAAAAMGVAVAGRRSLVVAWLVSFAAIGALGMWDFRRWQHDYGTNLDAEHAIIKVPGMTYEPPLVGTKQLLNFTATSFPASGSVLLGVAFVLGLVAVRRGKADPSVAALPRDDRDGGAALPRDDRDGGAALPRDGQVWLSSRAQRGICFLCLCAGARVSHAQGRIDVTPASTISAAITKARARDSIVIHAGRYAESLIVVTKPLTIVGDGAPVLDGGGRHGLIVVRADDVTIRGLTLANVGTSFVEDRAAIRVEKARGCTIAENRVENAFFGIYLSNVTDCRVTGNVIRGRAERETEAGNGIHLWTSRGITVADNQIAGHRDGIYFEFVHDSDVRANESTRNLRYGLHFMYSDDCRYDRNVFVANGSGVAVMYTKRVTMTGNRFERNWGAAAYGLLLKEIADSRLEGNVFRRNTTALVADGASRLVAEDNEFADNGQAVRLEASTDSGRFARNTFAGNTFDVTTNSRTSTTVFAGNHWDAYRGYDLDRNGVGDVPHHPVRLFSVLVEHHPPAMILMRGAFIELLEAAERVLPSLTPEAVVDATPSMRAVQRRTK